MAIVIVYEGAGAEVMVGGLGVFVQGDPVEISDPHKVELAKQLIATNVNFREVKKRKGDQ